MKFDETSILAVIVLYKIRLDQSETFQSLKDVINGKKLDLIVFDNSPEYNKTLDTSIYDAWPITYIASKKNYGVSKAYNTAATIAFERKKEWILLLDQDTFFPSNSITEYLNWINQYPDENLFVPIITAQNNVIISPCKFKMMWGFATNEISVGLNNLAGKSAINCGLLVDLKAFFKNGGYNESILLDYSDHDFIKRFNQNVTHTFVVIELRLNHHLSIVTKNSVRNELLRFTFLVNGSTSMAKSFKEKIQSRLTLYHHALKLSRKHRNPIFLLKLLQT